MWAPARSIRSVAVCMLGEYIIMVQDVTSPPFLGVLLEPAAVCVTVSSSMSSTQPTQRKSIKHRTGRNSHATHCQ